MPEFQRKATRFAHRGMQWDQPVDSIPEGQVAFARNVRVSQVDAIYQRPGLTTFANLATTGSEVIHSISVLNNFNTQLINIPKAFIVGMDAKIFVGDTSAHLTNPGINPVTLPHPATPLSGNPLTMVDMAPFGTNVGWKYIGDANQNLALGYYPGDTTSSRARCLTMGMTPPVFDSGFAVSRNPSGFLLGEYYWKFAFRNRYTGARSNPSAATRETVGDPKYTMTNEEAVFTTPFAPVDSVAADILVDIYRAGGTVPDWRYVGTTTCNTVFTDTMPDSSIITGSPFPEVLDPGNPNPRPNIYRPFVTQDNARYSTVNGTVTFEAGKYYLNANSPDTFDVNWLPGSFLGINFGNYSIHQVISPYKIEIVEDLSSFTSDVFPANYVWATNTGTLKAGTPMPHIWGPYGLGVTGAYIFACGGGDAGTLYWTNGNDPDSCDLANSLVVTSPSEPLRGGCIYDGTPFCWSTERMFRIYPGNVSGQFTVQEVPGGKGIWAEYSLTVQSNGIADQSVSWVGKDGIYDWTAGNGLQCLTDGTLYTFFPRGNQPGFDLGQIFPWLGEPHPVGSPSFASSNMRYHRLCWFQGDLFYDFPDAASTYHSLVFDSRQAHGWVSLDQYSNGVSAISQKPACRGIEIAANNLKVGIGPILLDYTGITDAGTVIPCRLSTRADDLGDSRIQKLYGDYWLDIVTGTNTVAVTPWVNNYSNQLATFTVPANTLRQQLPVDLSSGLGQLGRNWSLDLSWTAAGLPAVLYQYAYSYVGKPELVGFRATDKTDDGYAGAKYLRGLCIEANTGGVARSVRVLVDDAVAATLTVTSATQQEVPFAITPQAGSEFQLQPVDASHTWELFTIRWVWEKWPDLTALESNWLNMSTSKPKYIRSFSIPISGPNSVPLSFLATYDGNSTYSTTSITPASLVAKSPAQFSFNPPIVAHQLKLAPSTACRCWYEEIVWDAEEWPEIATLYGPMERLGSDSSAKYVRGVNMPIETGGAPVVMSLLHDHQVTTFAGSMVSEDFPQVITTTNAKVVFAFTPAIPCIGHIFQLKSNAPARFWYNEIHWEFEPCPEFDLGPSPWLDAGTPSAKFMQGLVFPVDTGGQPVIYDLTYDIPGGSATIQIGPFTTQAGMKSPVPYSFPVPFIAHEFQLSPRTACRGWYEDIKWVWEPVPELVTTYTTQETNMDLPGYHYMFDAYIAYIGSADAPLFMVKTEYGTETYTLPVSSGVFTRKYFLLKPQKAKWRSFSITSTGGIRLFLKDCEIRAKGWTDKGNYPSAFQSHHPFGDTSREVGARI